MPPLRTVFDSELKLIQDDVVRLGTLVEEAMANAFKAFGENDVALAYTVAEGDDLIDSLHQRLEEEITTTLATQQPVVQDQRRMIAALLIANELERMGDYAEAIALHLIHRVGEPGASDLELVTSMREVADQMIREMMNAYKEEHVEKAQNAAAYNDHLDAMYKQLFDQIVNDMGEGRLTIHQGTYQLWVAQYLERIGSRVVNIGERIIYSSTGESRAIRPKVSGRPPVKT